MISTGDVIEFMENRIICGDSRDPAILRYAKKSKIKVDTHFIDPPYDKPELYIIPDKKNNDDILLLVSAPYNYLAGIDNALATGWNPLFEFIWDGCVSWKKSDGNPLFRHKSIKAFGSNKWNQKRAVYTDGRPVNHLAKKHTYLQTVYRENFAKMNSIHPHEKPVSWLTGIIGGLGSQSILDYYAGSCSMLFASLNVGIMYTGIELNSKVLDDVLGKLVLKYPQHPVNITKVIK